MSFIGELLGGGAAALVNAFGGVVDQFVESDEDKAAAKFQLETLFQADRMAIEETHRKEMDAKQNVLIAELQQGDNFTKRARPMVVYAGLAAIIWNYSIAPLWMADPMPLPIEFYAAWGGICTTWVIGRTAERRGATNKIVNLITGSR